MNLFFRKYAKCSVAIFLLVLPFLLTACGTKKKNQQDTATTSTEYYFELADSSELVLQFPEELAEYVVREQATYDTATTEAFYIKAGDKKIPLFRIDVGNKELGDWLGVLKTKSGDIPVTYTVFAVSEEDMALLGENANELYDRLMNGFNVILEGIFNDSRFSSEKLIEVGENKNVSMNYWSVELPDNMWITENIEDGNYEAVFYTQIRGENIELYTVRIGDVLAETELGLFKVDGEKKQISVGSFDLPEKPNWTTDDYSTAYRMMDTINEVVNVIITSKQFSEIEAE